MRALEISEDQKQFIAEMKKKTKAHSGSHDALPLSERRNGLESSPAVRYFAFRARRAPPCPASAPGGLEVPDLVREPARVPLRDGARHDSGAGKATGAAHLANVHADRCTRSALLRRARLRPPAPARSHLRCRGLGEAKGAVDEGAGNLRGPEAGIFQSPQWQTISSLRR
jgi:hypothetical protein